VYFRLLGPIEVHDRGSVHRVGSLKEQCVLAALLIEAGRTVSAQALADRLWDEPPLSARETLQAYVSRLRKMLKAVDVGTAAIKGGSAGYRIDAEPEQIDLRRFEHLVVKARGLAASDPVGAVRIAREAEALWGGEPLAGLTSEWALAVRSALLERRHSVVLLRIELELRTGTDVDRLVGELTELTTGGPVDQAAVALLMTALCYAGRQDEALAVFQRTAERLAGSRLRVRPRAQLIQLRAAILNGEIVPPGSDPGYGSGRGSAVPAAAGAQAVAVVRDTLGPDPKRFLGRDREIDDLLAVIRQEQRPNDHVVLVSVDGMPGVGKSAFALRLAHRLRPHCPGGSLQLNLRSHHPCGSALGPHEALIELLEAIGTPAGEIGRADTTDALATLWRRRSGRRQLLLVLDDVADATQVAALVPSAPGSVVLTTSRRRLSGLADAHHRTLRLFGRDESRALMRNITGLDAVDDDEQLGRVVDRCGGLPLALSVAAANLLARPSWGLKDLADRLTRSGTLPVGDPLTEPIRAAFAMSYDELDPALQTLLRRISAHPGHEFDLPAACALADEDSSVTDVLLDILVEYRLVEEPARHCYRIHDLLREYALHLGSTSHETHSALGRLLEYYTAAVQLACRKLYAHPRVLEPSVLPTRALPEIEAAPATEAWLARELPNIVTMARYALDHAVSPYFFLLPHLLMEHFDRHGHWQQAVELLTRAVVGTPTDSVAAAQLEVDLAAAYVRTGQTSEAMNAAERSLAMWKARRDLRGQADALYEVGRVGLHIRRMDKAVRALTEAAELFDRLGLDRGRAAATNYLGIVLFQIGQPDDASAHLISAVAVARSVGDRVVECDALTNLGNVCSATNRPNEALDHFRQAEEIAEQLADPYNLAALANNRGALLLKADDPEGALPSFQRAADQFHALGDTGNEIGALVNLADCHVRCSEHERAEALLGRALYLVEQVGDPLRRTQVQLAAGGLHLSLGRVDPALAAYHDALIHARDAAAAFEQAQAHRALDQVLRAAGDPAAARSHRRQARELYRRLNHPDAAIVASDD
jgi:tetratricopeptide (TPR) repeat protein/DNA-binding SARP family transcriptional activator